MSSGRCCAGCKDTRSECGGASPARAQSPFAARRAPDTTRDTTPAIGPHTGHEFERLRVSASASSESRNGLFDEGDEGDDPIHRGMIDEFRRREGLPPGGRDEGGERVGPSDGEIKYSGMPLGMPRCPSTVRVGNVVDLRAAALAAGIRTAYGIHAPMHVGPDRTDWDGTSVTEANVALPGTCPETLTQGPRCSGHSTFVVGAQSGRSQIAPARPGIHNAFWDYHVTHVRQPNVSVLHDRARNPANLNTCSAACNQTYRCGSTIIGQFTVTRTFTKGVYNGQDVTFVDVTKT